MQWHAPLGSCCTAGFGTCALSFCCPCVVYGSNNEAVGQSFVSSCLLYGCLCVCFHMECLVHVPFRGDVRKMHGLEEQNIFTDCLIIWCCSPCALIQEATQVDPTLQDRLQYPGDSAQQQQQQQQQYDDPYGCPPMPSPQSIKQAG